MAIHADGSNTNQFPSTEAAAVDADRRFKLHQISWLIWAGLLAVLALFIFVTMLFQIQERNQIRSGVTVFGIDVGGMTREEATTTLEEVAAARSSQPLNLVDGDRSWQLTQGELGFTVDIEGAVEEAFAGGRSGYGASRFAIFWHLKDDPLNVGADYVAVNTAVTDTELEAIANDIFQIRIEPELIIADDATYTYTNHQVGRVLDIEATRTSVLSALSTGTPSLDVTVIEDHPLATDEDYAQVINQLNTIFDSDITFEADGQTWVLGPSKINYWLTLHPAVDGQPASLTIDEGWAEAVVDEIAFAVNHQPQSTRVWWGDGGQIVVTRDPSPGFHLNWDASFAVVKDAFTGINAENVQVLPGDVLEAPPLPADLATLGLNAVIAESSTPYGASIDERKHNIELAARMLNGALVMPGQIFSFNSEIGPMTTDAGFQVAYGIANEGGSLRTVPAEAGGICQVATTVFQPVFVTGYEVEQRTTHSYWIQSYNYNGMVGLDATVDSESGLDLKWRNNSPYPVMVQAEADGDYFTVRLIGHAPDWSVEILPPEINDIVEAEHDKTYYQADTELEPGKLLRIEHAEDGFEVRVVRIVHDNGEDRVWDVKVKYGVSRNVVLVGSPSGELPPEYQ